jgi:cyclopropane fatty-acyl-phospholipid synthase-like methyltransferase
MLEKLAKWSEILKTDLWNEGVGVGRNIASNIPHMSEVNVLGLEMSRSMCEYARKVMSRDIQIVRGSLLAPPFRSGFDLIADISTIDHVPESLRFRWMSNEASLLKINGLQLIAFDCRFSIFTEMYHRMCTRRFYPEWTLHPSTVRSQLESAGFTVMEEHAVFLLGLFFPLGRA